MRLNAKILKNVASVNHWEYAETAHVQEGQINEIYIQLIDLDKKLAQNCPLRYLSQATVLSVEATFPSIDDAQVITIVGTQPFSDDKSIWKFTLSSSQLPNSGAVQIKIDEDGAEKRFNILGAIEVGLINDGGC